MAVGVGGKMTHKIWRVEILCLGLVSFEGVQMGVSKNMNRFDKKDWGYSRDG